jgi:hypothetical protein
MAIYSPQIPEDIRNLIFLVATVPLTLATNWALIFVPFAFFI